MFNCVAYTIVLIGVLNSVQFPYLSSFVTTVISITLGFESLCACHSHLVELQCMQGSWKEHLTQKFRNWCGVDQADDKDKRTRRTVSPMARIILVNHQLRSKGRHQLVNPGLLQKVCGIVCVTQNIYLRINKLLKWE